MRKHSVKNEPCYCNSHTDYVTCCDTFYQFLNDCKVGLKYHKDSREFTFLISRNMGRMGIYNCPWCGFKLPESLRSMRFDILEQEYGLDAPHEKDQVAKTPAEYLTDEWWKKRGL